MKIAYEIRQIDAMNDGFWYWNESYHIGEFETSFRSRKTDGPYFAAIPLETLD